MIVPVIALGGGLVSVGMLGCISLGVLMWTEAAPVVGHKAKMGG
jgi:hypothetical protein